ncbi:MAG: flagellar basal body L-ring protein FlgH [Planctomycetes bacterium]|nr:flagellar basal body L-ring protein FlgH [Planctomycetota bacterium]
MIAISSVVLLIQSLWGEGAQDPYDPPKKKTYKLHDHVKIFVNDKSKALTRADLRTDQRTRWETEFDDFIRFDVSAKGNRRLRAAELADDPAIDVDARFRQDNLSRTGREFALTFNIAAEIIEIQPNGNLILQARRKRKINEETEVIKLTGVVSVNAVREGGIAMSDDIADLDLSYEGSGSVSDSSKRGILGWLLSIIWPF